jgi:hypothetical protein
MDSKQFDELVARLASTASRRNAVKGVLGGTLASAGVTSVVSAKKKGGASAKKKGGSSDKKKPCENEPKLIVCHKGRKTKRISACKVNKFNKHIAHGDAPSPCYGD